MISLASRGAHTLATPHSQQHRDMLSLPAPNQQLCSNSCNQTQLMNGPLNSQHINNNIVHSPNNLNSNNNNNNNSNNNNNNNNSNINNNSVSPPGNGESQENTQPNAVSVDVFESFLGNCDSSFDIPNRAAFYQVQVVRLVTDGAFSLSLCSDCDYRGKR